MPTDPLTGAYRRAFAAQQLEAALKRSLRRGEPLSVLMIDLDRFKVINDQYGRQAGDKALAAVGSLLRGGLRDTDIVGRYGGDEFIVVLPMTGAAGAMTCAQRLLKRAATLQIETRDDAIPVRVSLGIGTLLPADLEEPIVDRERLMTAIERLIESADRALYAARGTGRAGELPSVRWAEVPDGMRAA